eukprot:1434328-Alexandrium_andersonii.AAC.1
MAASGRGARLKGATGGGRARPSLAPQQIGHSGPNEGDAEAIIVDRCELPEWRQSTLRRQLRLWAAGRSKPPAQLAAVGTLGL